MAASRLPEIKVWPSPPSLRAVSRCRSMRSPAPPRAGGHSISRMEAGSFQIERDRQRRTYEALAGAKPRAAERVLLSLAA